MSYELTKKVDEAGSGFEMSVELADLEPCVPIWRIDFGLREFAKRRTLPIIDSIWAGISAG